MDRKKYEDGIQYIADAYGVGNQQEKLIEELSELLVAVTHDDRKNISEEMADVRIMIDQMTYLYDAEEVIDKLMERKVKKALERLEGIG